MGLLRIYIYIFDIFCKLRKEHLSPDDEILSFKFTYFILKSNLLFCLLFVRLRIQFLTLKLKNDIPRTDRNHHTLISPQSLLLSSVGFLIFLLSLIINNSLKTPKIDGVNLNSVFFGERSVFFYYKKKAKNQLFPGKTIKKANIFIIRCTRSSRSHTGKPSRKSRMKEQRGICGKLYTIQ